MKRKYIVLGFTIAIVVIGIFSMKFFLGIKPFKNLSILDISSVSVNLLPADTNIELNRREIQELVDVLKTIIIYKKDDSYRDYAGQAVIFIIAKTDGSKITINAYNRFIIIDGSGYRTKYEPCEKLNTLGNAISQASE